MWLTYLAKLSHGYASKGVWPKPQKGAVTGEKHCITTQIFDEKETTSYAPLKWYYWHAEEPVANYKM